MTGARGCLETVGIAVFALLLGAFAASTLIRHADRSGDSPAVEGVAPSRVMPPEERARIRVEVRNGSGEPGAAGRMTDFLRSAGFDVVDFGNADRFDHERTVVVDRVGDPRRAREVAAALQGVPIRTDPDSSLILDATVLVGADLEEVLARVAEERGRRGGWRRWLDRIPWPWG